MQKMGMRKEEADTIFDLIDYEKGGTIQFTEFCTACLDKEFMLTDEKLLAVFREFDIDRSGDISYQELRLLFGIRKDDISNGHFVRLVKIIKEMDEDGDGTISFQEFSHIMRMLVIG